jgi:hypothetical protein
VSPANFPPVPRHPPGAPIPVPDALRDALADRYAIERELGRVYLLLGEPDKALEQLEPLLDMPFYLTPGWLRVDPTFDPLRKNPRFKKLVEGTA